jgi:hypothetical protein
MIIVSPDRRLARQATQVAEGQVAWPLVVALSVSV